jgi:hypothetical protein
VGWWVCGSVTYYWKMVVSWGNSDRAHEFDCEALFPLL